MSSSTIESSLSPLLPPAGWLPGPAFPCIPAPCRTQLPYSRQQRIRDRSKPALKVYIPNFIRRRPIECKPATERFEVTPETSTPATINASYENCPVEGYYSPLPSCTLYTGGCSLRKTFSGTSKSSSLLVEDDYWAGEAVNEVDSPVMFATTSRERTATDDGESTVSSLGMGRTGLEMVGRCRGTEHGADDIENGGLKRVTSRRRRQRGSMFRCMFHIFGKKKTE
jgi:hypothetical protein